MGYVRLVTDCFTSGDIGNDEEVNETLRLTEPLSDMAAVDWMLLSTIQSQANWWYPYLGRKDDDREGMSTGQEIWA